ncbi:MAG: hypothetical protein ABH834_00175 [Candidatus Altiarchaeota archaeon]
MVKRVVKQPGDMQFKALITAQLDRDFAQHLPANLSHMTEPEKEKAAAAILFRASDTLIQSLNLEPETEERLKRIDERRRRRSHIQARIMGPKRGLPKWEIDPEELRLFFSDFRDSLTEVTAAHPEFKIGQDQHGEPLTAEIMLHEVNGALLLIGSDEAPSIIDERFLASYCTVATKMHSIQLRDCLGDKTPEFIRRSRIVATEYEKRLVSHPEYPNK